MNHLYYLSIIQFFKSEIVEDDDAFGPAFR